MDLAERACDIEINQLKQPSGKQDQYISVYGGISEFNINKSGKVRVKNLNISKDIISKLEKNLLLFFTGFSRNSSLILNEQDNKTKKKEKDMIENLDFVKSIGLEIKNELVKGNCEGFAKLMNTHWKYKLKRSKNMSNKSIDNLYSYALKNKYHCYLLSVAPLIEELPTPANHIANILQPNYLHNLQYRQ